jgi:hypothetical protein
MMEINIKLWRQPVLIINRNNHTNKYIRDKDIMIR